MKQIDEDFIDARSVFSSNLKFLKKGRNCHNSNQESKESPVFKVRLMMFLNRFNQM